MKQSVYELEFDELSEWFNERADPSYRAEQVFEWAYTKNAASFSEMSNLSKELRAALAEEFRLGPIEPKSVSEAEGATKLLLPMAGGGEVEAVRISMGNTFTVCLSTQLGCAIGCKFCATAQMNCERNLTVAEIIQQLITARAMGGQVSNVVLMGMGEPMHNYENVVAAVRRMIDTRAFGMSPSRITVSSAGVVPKIRQYAGEGLETELTISLNAPDDELRQELMPGVAKWSIAELLDACGDYTGATGGQPVTFAYVLIEGVNDDFQDAEKLAELLRGQRHHLNIIPMNPVSATEYSPPSEGRIRAFVGRCEKLGLNVSLRRTKGREVDAACGQLRTRQQ